MVLSNFNHSYISKYILKFTLDAKIDEFEKNIFPPSKQCAIVDISLTTYLPHLVYVVFGCPLRQ